MPTRPTFIAYAYAKALELLVYWMLGIDGKVYSFGDAPDLGGIGIKVADEFVDLEPNPTGEGYWLLQSSVSFFVFGAAKPFGSVDRAMLSAREHAASLSATPSGHGYWIFTTKGRVFAFGDATSYGDMSGTTLNSPVLDSITTPTGNGYYMVASDGGIFAFGDATFRGSMGGTKLNAPVQSLVPDPDGVGYWLVASDGGVFAFEAGFRGSMGSSRLNKPITGMVPYGNGYLMSARTAASSASPTRDSPGPWGPPRQPTRSPR